MADILVTGAKGFIGSHLVASLRGRHVVHAVDRSHGQIEAPSTWAALPKAELVIHLAGRSYVPASWDEPVGFIKANLAGTLQALDYCRSNGARLIFASSYVYGTPDTNPIDETAPVRTPNPYAFSKKTAEDACVFYAQTFGVPITILRPFNIFGPGQDQAFLIPSIITQVLAQGVVVVKDLEPRRDYLFIEDFVGAVEAAIAHATPLEIFNIGSGESHSVAEVIAAISDAVGGEVAVRSEGVRRPNEIMDVCADIGKARRLLGWQPRLSFQEGCIETVRAHRMAAGSGGR